MMGKEKKGSEKGEEKNKKRNTVENLGFIKSFTIIVVARCGFMFD